MLYASCKKLSMCSTSYLFFRVGAASFAFRHMLKSGVMLAISLWTDGVALLDCSDAFP